MRRSSLVVKQKHIPMFTESTLCLALTFMIPIPY
jgi:hypothetical protein